MRLSLLIGSIAALTACRGTTVDTAATVDADGDGFVVGADCNDEDATVNDEAPELCDGVDNDCNELIDDEAVDGQTFYIDADGDSYGGSSATAVACDPPAGFVADSSDCNDGDDAIHPGAPETECTDPTDYNCDGSVGYDDADGDGWAACQDCDDGSAGVNPTVAEACDGIDNDCDGQTDEPGSLFETTFYADADGDGFGNIADQVSACEAPEGYTTNSSDCDDLLAEVFPGATEVCDNRDNDCNGNVDGDAVDLSSWYADVDGDGFGAASVRIEACEQEPGFVDNTGDCDDDDSSAFPGATEVCDGDDENCDGIVDDGLETTWYADNDEDGQGSSSTATEACEAPAGYVANALDCDDSDDTVRDGAAEVCNGVDNDCNGTADDGFDVDGDGHTTCDGDCNDDDASVNPAMEETCDGVDQDCDGGIDEGATDLTTFYVDFDDDGYGDDRITTEACSAPSGFSATDDDCDDTDSAYNPGATPGCDGMDYDCDGAVDSDADGDDYADIDCGGDDCDDSDDTVFPDVGGGCALGTNCEDVLLNGYDDGDGEYTIDPDGFGTGADPYPVMCDMTTDGGGWTLMMKASEKTFPYDSAYWTNNAVFNETSLDTSFDSAKFQSFMDVPVDELLLISENGFSTQLTVPLEDTMTGHFSGPTVVLGYVAGAATAHELVNGGNTTVCGEPFRINSRTGCCNSNVRLGGWHSYTWSCGYGADTTGQPTSAEPMGFGLMDLTWSPFVGQRKSFGIRQAHDYNTMPGGGQVEIGGQIWGR